MQLTYIKPRNFYDVYILQISARLKKIDMFIKSSAEPICVRNAAKALEISEEEVRFIMKEAGIDKIRRNNFFDIMLCGSSYICRLLNREAELLFPIIYSHEDIAYIYDLDIEDVRRAGYISGVYKATSLTLPALFYHIPA